MTERTSASWVVYALGALCAGAIVAAVLVVGPASGSQSAATRTATVAQGVVQSTVSGTGNLQPASQLNLGFKTGGTVTNIYVKQGQEVAQGQLLAALDPQSAEVTLEQAKASLQSAEANLAREEETGGEGSTATREREPKEAGSSTGAGSSSTSNTGTGSSSTSKTSTGSTSTSTVSTATREANLASARATVKSDALTVQSDEQAVQNTRLYAPESGTIASLSGEVGETVSASGTTKDTAGASSSGASSSTAGGASASAGRSSSASGSGSGTSSSSSSTGSSSFAVLSDLSSMQLVVALSESEIGNVRVGQIATITIEALDGRKVAAHVSEVAILSTSNSGVVSYDVTFQLDQLEAGLKPGMSATAEVVVKQAEGVNVPTTAISAGTVTVVRSGKDVRQRVVTGLAGNSSTIVLSGLKAGETIVLPSTSTSSSNSTNSLLSRRIGGLGGGGGGGFAGGGGGAAFFRGGG
jgi:multidrug efflux pump subunit AcrA (membrane-fusion protein)